VIAARGLTVRCRTGGGPPVGPVAELVVRAGAAELPRGASLRWWGPAAGACDTLRVPLRLCEQAEPVAAADGGREVGFLEFTVARRGRRC
jgi:hypothetical protein